MPVLAPPINGLLRKLAIHLGWCSPDSVIPTHNCTSVEALDVQKEMQDALVAIAKNTSEHLMVSDGTFKDINVVMDRLSKIEEGCGMDVDKLIYQRIPLSHVPRSVPSYTPLTVERPCRGPEPGCRIAERFGPPATNSHFFAVLVTSSSSGEARTSSIWLFF